MGNPFFKNSEDLLVLDTRDIAGKNVINTVNSIEAIGKEQFHDFVNKRLKSTTISLFDPIRKNKLPLFSQVTTKATSKSQTELVTLKKNCQLFSQLYIACQIRDGNLDDFFSHENQSFPPSLSKNGDLRPGAKADLLKCLEDVHPCTLEKPVVSCIILDGPAVVNMLSPDNCSTFRDYASNVFLPFIYCQLQICGRIDIIWDAYREKTLKASARRKRGAGIRRRVLTDSKIPSNWHSFLRVDKNKEELLTFLALESSKIMINKIVLSTYGEMVVSTSNVDESMLVPCTHEEADTRIFLHVKNASMSGNNTVMIRTVDTDVAVIGVTLFQKLGVKELWLWFGTGKNQ